MRSFVSPFVTKFNWRGAMILLQRAPLPRLDPPRHDTEQRMSLRRDLSPAAVELGIARAELAQQMIPFVIELPCRDRNGGPMAHRSDLALVEGIASDSRLVEDPG